MPTDQLTGAPVFGAGWTPKALGEGGFRRLLVGPAIDISGASKNCRNHRGYYEKGVHYVTADAGTATGANSENPDVYLFTANGLAPTGPFLNRGSIVNISTFTPLKAQYTTMTAGVISPDGQGGYQLYMPVVDHYYSSNNTADVYRLTAPTPLGPWTLAVADQTPAIPMAATPTPTGLGVTANPSGGSFAANTYYWKITALSNIGESLASNEATVAIAANGTATLTWTAVSGATGYKIYRSTSSGGQGTSPAFVASVGAVTTYTDTGTAVSSGSVPTLANYGCPDMTGQPVFFNGQWVMAGTWIQLGTGNRSLRLWTSSTPRGPWTMQPVLTVQNGAPSLSTDSPGLIVSGARLFLHTCPDTYNIVLGEVDAALANLYPVTPTVFQVPHGDTQEGGNNQWGAGMPYIAEGNIYFIYMGMPNAGNLYKGFVAEWQPGLARVPCSNNQWNVASAQTISSSPTTINLPSWLHRDAVAVELLVQVKETSGTAGTVLTNAENVQIDPGYSNGGFLVFPQAAGVNITLRGRVDLWSNQSVPSIRVTANGSTTMQVSIAIVEYYRLP